MSEETPLRDLSALVVGRKITLQVGERPFIASVPIIHRCSSCWDALAFYFHDSANIALGNLNLPYNFVSLEQSAIRGCDLCRILWQALIYEEPSGVDMQSSAGLVQLSSDSIKLTVQLQCDDSQGHPSLISKVLLSKSPDLKPMRGNIFEPWDPLARMVFDICFYLYKLIMVQDRMDLVY
jgi:hypothetical protein